MRVTASQARKKLEQYFAADGASEPVVLEIPKGQYTPVFRERIAPIEAPDGAAPAVRVVWPSRVVLVLSACVAIA